MMFLILAIGFLFGLVRAVALFLAARACLAYRRLSRHLVTAAWGFGGLCVCMAIQFLNLFLARLETAPWVSVICQLIELSSTIALVYGIRGALAEIGGKVDIVKWPTNDLE